MNPSPAHVTRAQDFQRLHIKGNPVVLFNVWDAGSAKAVAAAGAKAIATGSWSVAAAHGVADGQALPLADALANLTRIVAAVSLPVTIDLEAGYGGAPEVVADTLARAIAAGAIGCNLEDQIIGGSGLYPIKDQALRIRAAREAAERAAVPAFINARTDVFLQSAQHEEGMVRAALERARAYADAGASGIFVPGLMDEKLVALMCEQSPLPVNIMTVAGEPSAGALARLGVARVSYGPGPYRQAMQALEQVARRIYSL